ATCGTELGKIAVPSNDVMKSFCFEEIKIMVLRSAVNYLSN
ncbi:unnamed protein product, partial [marine sediment metagenome]